VYATLRNTGENVVCSFFSARAFVFLSCPEHTAIVTTSQQTKLEDERTKVPDTCNFIIYSTHDASFVASFLSA
jgi:hypothetical protein